MKHQIVIIGSGLGGLLSAVFLAKEGYDVIVLEQNKQIGGCLQTFSFDKKVFDAAVHYVGSLASGEVLHKIFSYVGIMQDLRVKRMDLECFDEVIFDEQPQSYRLGQGKINFIQQLSYYFPDETDSIDAYFKLLEDTCSSYPLYNLRTGNALEKEQFASLSLSSVLEEIVPNAALRAVLLGNSILYAGMDASTPWSTHALVAKSYIDSAWRIEGGASQISKLLWRRLQALGGKILNREKVIKLLSKEGKIVAAQCESGLMIEGDYFIANMHPSKAIDLLAEPNLFKKIYRDRIQNLANTVACLMLNIVLEPGKVVYKNFNVNWNVTDPLKTVEQLEHIFPVNYSIYYTEDEANKGFAESVSILTYINSYAFSHWKDSFNTSQKSKERSQSYRQFKEEKARVLLEKVAERFPEIKQFKKSWKIATPLSYRDYQGSVEGSLYGIKKDVNTLSASNLSTRTRIPNLRYTGQNVNLHGVLGVSMTAILTAADFVGLDYLLEKVNDV